MRHAAPPQPIRELRTAAFVAGLFSRPPELAYTPGLTPKAFAAWQGKVRRKLKALLAFPRVPRQPSPRLLREEPRPGYRLQTWELYPEPGSAVPFLMLVPDGVSAARPAGAVLCIPGTDHPKEGLCGEPVPDPWKPVFEDARQAMALQVVRAGLIAVAFDNPGTAALHDPERPDWKRQAEHLIWVGRSYEGLSVFQKRAAFRWLRTRPEVDPARIAACGFSLGAKPALLLGVLEPRLAAVVWNDQASSWRERELATRLAGVPPWHLIPGFLRWFDYTDLMAALAPRPLLITEGGRLADHAHIRRAYAGLGATARFKVTFMPNFADPAKRTRAPLPDGLSPQNYARYANYDGAHYFKPAIAVPWLRRFLEVAPRA
jgi:hypothetical protein